VRHQPRIWRREIVCGADPRSALARALLQLPVSGGEVWSIGVRHDDGCGSLEPGASMQVCSCEIVELEARRAA
jgi:hypothetical protein